MITRGHLSVLPWLAGGAAIALLEIAVLASSRPFVILTTLTLLLALGLLCGVVIAAQEWLVDRLGLGAFAAAWVRALGAIAPLSLAAIHLFDGGMASTIPGASYGYLWVPAAGFVALAAVLWPASLLTARPRDRRFLTMALASIAVVVDYANRTLLSSVYADIHALLTVIAVVLVGAAVHLGLGARARILALPAARRTLAALVLVLAGTAIPVLFLGLQTPAERWIVATRGVHTRQLARLVRIALDRDRDGYALVFGGGDCDDQDATINPAALDIPGNGRDEDCDGADTPVAAPLPPETDRKAALAAWRARPEVVSTLARIRGYNLLLIVVDTLRGDMLDATAANQAAFPHLFALQADSHYFRRAFSTASGTDMALAAFFTSRIDPFVPLSRTFTEALAETGRITHAVIPAEVLRWASETLVTRGLRDYDRLVTDSEETDVGDHATGAELTDLGLAFLNQNRNRPLFLWLHYFDVHEHHQLPSSDPRMRAALGDSSPDDQVARYRASVKLIDDEVGRVVNGLRENGLWDNTIVVLMSDHGESLGEDPRLPETHGRFLYNSLIHIPLLIRIPGHASRAIDTPVSIVDIAPSLLTLLGIQPLADADGSDLAPMLLGDPPAALASRAGPLVLNESEQRGIIDWPYKLLVRPHDNLVELFDIAADFTELNDLADMRSDLVGRLDDLYKRFPPVVVDRTLAGRKAREVAAKAISDAPGGQPGAAQ